VFRCMYRKRGGRERCVQVHVQKEVREGEMCSGACTERGETEGLLHAAHDDITSS